MTARSELGEELRTTGRRFCALVAELGPVAVELADLEARLRAAEHQAGHYHDAHPLARELAVEVPYGHLQALCPYLPQATEATAQHAAEELLRSPDA